VTIKGFVPDIDEEILSSAVFLMCNNAGSYSGGYTRVIYAMATGACMVAHRGIAHSMPEVRHGENALLGETPQEIAGLVEQAYRDPELRKRIGVAARATYETQYHPRAVARKLADLAVNLR
jgi:glycosyltransferase involved in cell wall biosynthesis